MGLTDELRIEDEWSEDNWDLLLGDIKDKVCVPFIGPGASDKWIQLDEIVNEWAGKEWEERYRYPYSFEDSSQLPRLSQFMATVMKEGEAGPKKKLSRLLKEKALPDFSLPEHKYTVYAVLADLNLPIYITTNYDHVMEKALTDKGKKPISDYSIWKESKDDSRKKERKKERTSDTSGGSQPTSAEPLVFHLLGDIDTPTFMVLTEKDYIDFAIYLNKDSSAEKYAFPHSIRRILSQATLLFIGYRLEDISFIIVFEGFIKLFSSGEIESVAVQVQIPTKIGPDKKEAIRTYLNKLTESYFKIHIYWGDPDRFLQQLRDRWSKVKGTNK